MSTGGSEYTLSVKLNVTNLAEVRKQIASLGEGAVGGVAGAGARGGGRGGGAGQSAASAPGYENAAATTAAATSAATNKAPVVTQATLRQRANLAINTAIANMGYVGGLTTMEAITRGKMYPELSEAAQLGIKNRAITGEGGMAVRAAQARLEIAKAMRSGGLFGKAEQLNRLAGDQSYSPSQRLGFATQLEATLDKIEERTAREEERQKRQEAARERAQQRAEERRAREEERQRRREEARERAQKRAEERQARSNMTAEERLKRAREGVAVSRATAEGGMFGRANALYGLTQDPSIPEMRRLGYEKQLHQTMARIERSTSAYERKQASMAGEPPGPTPPAGASSGSASGGGGGFRAAMGRFFGPPSLMNLYFATVFGAWELSQARQRIAAAEAQARYAPDRISRMKAELAAATAGFQGPIGGMVGEVMNLFGKGPANITRDMTEAIEYVSSEQDLYDARLRLRTARSVFGLSQLSPSEAYLRSVRSIEGKYNEQYAPLARNLKELESRLKKDTDDREYNKTQVMSERRQVLSDQDRTSLERRIGELRANIGEISLTAADQARAAAEGLGKTVGSFVFAAGRMRISAYSARPSMSSVRAYRASRAIDRQEMLFGMERDPIAAGLGAAFDEETNAVASRMELLRELELSRYRTSTNMNSVIAEKIQAGRPYDVARQRAFARYYEAINRAEAIQDDELKDEMKKNAGSQLGVDIAEIERELANRKEQIRINQTTRAGQMTALERRREYGARVIGIGGSAIASARGFINEGLLDEARNEAMLGIRQVNLARRDYLEAFRGAQFDVRNIGMSDRDTEDIEGTLNDIHQTIQELMKVVENLAAN